MCKEAEKSVSMFSTTVPVILRDLGGFAPPGSEAEHTVLQHQHGFIIMFDPTTMVCLFSLFLSLLVIALLKRSYQIAQIRHRQILALKERAAMVLVCSSIGENNGERKVSKEVFYFFS